MSIKIIKSSNLPSPNSIGQVLFSVDGSQFTAQQPLTLDEGGWTSNNVGLMLVVG